MKEAVKRFTPTPVLNVVKTSYDAFMRLPQLPDAYLHPWRRISRSRMHAMHNIHDGERCFIIGNGPSLKQNNLAKLKNEFTFGMNRIYLLFPELGFNTTYYVSINDLVIEQCAQEIAALPIPKFISWHSNRHFQRLPDDLIFLYSTYTGARFAYDMTQRVWEGANKGKANQTVVSEGDDPNHFSPAYFGKGFRWQLPDLDTSEIGYTLARNAYQKAGREVLDATVNGKLTVFPKVDYNTLFQ